MSNSSYQGVVHTLSDYAPDYNLSMSGLFKARQDYRGKWQSLRERENQIYQRLFPQANGLETFLAQLRNVFDDLPQDSTVFRFFEAGSLQGAIADVIRRKETGNYHQLILTIKTKEPVTIDMQRLLTRSGAKITVSGSNVILELGANTEQIKTTLNAVLERKFNTKSKNIRAMRKFLNDEDDLLEELSKHLGAESFTMEKSSSTATLTQQVLMESPFRFTAQDLKDAQELGMNSELYQEITKAREEIYNLIWTRSGLGAASPQMQVAFMNVWNQNIVKNFEGLALFEKGGAYTALMGAFGEFQSALLIEYINQIAANGIGIPLIANSLKSGEQSKADVTFLGQIGIQVKNYNPMSSKGMLETNIHPAKLEQYGNIYGGEFADSDFMEFLANYFFNKTYRENNEGTMMVLEDSLGQYFGDIANLMMAEGVEDTVAFYIIEGQYFVPGSYILEAIENNHAIQKEVSITGPATPYGDDEYNYVEIRNKTRREAMFSRWWRPSADAFAPTPENYATYNSLLHSKISVRSGFNYKKLNLPQFYLY